MKQARLPRRSAILLALATGSMQSLALAAPVTPADAIYTGGTIVTVNEFQPQVEALAVRGGRIVAAGSRDEVMKMNGAKTRLVDLGGRTLVPGYVDPHGHVFNTGNQAISANLLPRPDGTVNDIAKMFAPSERLTLDQAIRAVTIDAAYMIGMENELGSIQAGRLADFAELDKDPYAMGVKGLRDIKVWGTVFEGQVHPANRAALDK
jgi:predicted amidohydrolase YtcJ